MPFPRDPLDRFGRLGISWPDNSLIVPRALGRGARCRVPRFTPADLLGNGQYDPFNFRNGLGRADPFRNCGYDEVSVLRSSQGYGACGQGMCRQEGYCGGGRTESSNPTKDIVVRGKTYKFRKSFLVEANKFEADLVKYMENMKEEQISTCVIEMLQDYINNDSYRACNIVEEVTLSILATNVGAKSVVAATLASLNKKNCVSEHDLAVIAPSILLSGKVDDDLKKWLKKQLKSEPRQLRLKYNRQWQLAVATHPELQFKVMELFGLIDPEEDERLRIL